MSNKKSGKTTNSNKKTTTSKDTKAVKSTKTVKKPVKKVEVKEEDKKNETIFAKYGTAIIIGALLVIFGIVLVATQGGESKESSKTDDVLVSMSVSEWQDKVKSEDVVVTTLAQTTCSWCNQFKPVMQEVAEENNLEVIWLDIDTVTSTEEEYNKLIGTFDELQNLGTPYTIITKSNKIIGEISGYVEKDELVKTLQEHGAL